MISAALSVESDAEVFAVVLQGLSNPASGGGTADFFGLAARRLDYIDQRQRVVAENIANADTPNYHPRDLSPFQAALGSAGVSPLRTNVLHLSGTSQTAGFIMETPQERSADGNTVNVEAQLTKVADDETSASLVGNLWKTTMGMYLTALGKG